MKQALYDDQYIVITGAAGFIGSATVAYLNEKGLTNLILVDDFKQTDKWKNLVGKKYCDLISRFDLMAWLKGKESEVSSFIHLGACSSTVEKDWDYLMKVNYNYSKDLASYALENGQRFIYASSAATFGMGENGYSDDHANIDPLTPLNPYGYSKQMFDQWVLRNGVIDQLVGLKFFNVFGPNEYHKGRMASMVLHMTHQIKKDKKVKLFQSSEPDRFNDGEQCRDFIYVKDAVKMTCFFLENNIGGIFNIGTGEANTWNRLANSVFSALNIPSNIEYVPMPIDLHGKYQNYTCADMGKFLTAYKKEMKKDYKFYILEEAVNDYVNCYLNQGAKW